MMARRCRGFPWATLERPLTGSERTALARSLGRLLAWQRSLSSWPVPPRAPDAIPFVSIYREGRLRGCVGSDEGKPGERVFRAFLRAMEDARHGGAQRADREALVAQVSYAREPVRVASTEEAIRRFDPGIHGVCLAPTGKPAAILLPSVAREGGFGARQILEVLAAKAGVDFAALDLGALYLFEADEVVARPGEPPALAQARHAPASLAAEWLSRLVRDDGFVHFGVDPRARTVHELGLMHHGRAAVVVRALAHHGRHRRDVERARDWLDHDVRAALRGKTVAGWPAEKDRVAGTIALACMGGLDLADELERFIAGDAFAESPWHAAQSVCVLGQRAPDGLWKACVASLRETPWAPWTVLAARARGDKATCDRAALAIERATRSRAPGRGSAAVTGLPELALTALSVEALAPLRHASARAALDRARRFLEAWQFLPGRVPGLLDPEFAEGAFPLTPVHPFARGDVTAHAVLALSP
jgi:hypothetical protein